MSANTPGGYLGQGPLPKDWRPEPKVQPLPRSWKEGDPLPQGTFSQPGYTPEQQAQIDLAQTSPGPEQIVYPVEGRLRDSQRRSDVAWGASNLVLDKGAQLAADDPSIAGAIRGKAAEYAMSHGMDAQRANNEWEKDRTRLDAIATERAANGRCRRWRRCWTCSGSACSVTACRNSTSRLPRTCAGSAPARVASP